MTPVMWDDDSRTFFVFDERCCGIYMYDTGCDAIGCTGYVCEQCGKGCTDLADPERGDCAMARRGESAEDHLARVNRQREGFGLRPIDQLTWE